MSQSSSEVFEVLFDNGFLQIRKTSDGYTFMHESRCKGQIVSLLPYRKAPDSLQLEYLGRVEICPAHGPDFELCSITGGKDPHLSIEETVCRELLEETGFTAEKDELIPLGIVKPTKAADTIVSLFAVDVTGKEQTPPQGDGSYFEKGAGIKWVNYEEAVQIEDPLLVTALARFHAQR